MERIKLTLEGRENKKPNQLRRCGKIPATVYGPEAKSVSFQVSKDDFTRLPVAAFSQIVDLDTPEGEIKALIRTVQRRHVTSEILNIEFYRVSLNRKLTVTVPLKFSGAPPAVQKGGILTIMSQSVDLECFPNEIPENIEVDLNVIEEIEQAIHFSDLKTTGTVKILNPLEELVARVLVKKEVPAPTAAGEGAAPAAEGAAPAPATGKEG
jgi:large subunit ribosomal protein L25